jgi:hypothetical protein
MIGGPVKWVCQMVDIASNSPTRTAEDGKPLCTCSECEEHPPGKCGEKALVRFSPQRLLCADCLMRLKNKGVVR